jgi:hypothetical protein
MTEKFIIVDNTAINLRHVRDINFNSRKKCFYIQSNVYRGTNQIYSATHVHSEICVDNPKFDNFVKQYRKLIDPYFVLPEEPK